MTPTQVKRLFEEYVKYEREEIKSIPTAFTKEKRNSGHAFKASRRIGLKGTKKVLAFYLKNNRWPNRNTLNKIERKLGQRYENLCSTESLSFDPYFREIALALGRKVNPKRKHAVKAWKEEIIAFVAIHGRTPSDKIGTHEEKLLSQKMSYYTTKGNDMTLLGQVYELDPCHKTGIPRKYRPLINSALNVDTPLVNMPKYKLEGK